MSEINWKFLEQIQKRTVLGQGSVVPQKLFVEYADQGLLDGTCQNARTTEKTRKALEEARKPKASTKRKTAQ